MGQGRFQRIADLRNDVYAVLSAARLEGNQRWDGRYATCERRSKSDTKTTAFHIESPPETWKNVGPLGFESRRPVCERLKGSCGSRAAFRRQAGCGIENTVRRHERRYVRDLVVSAIAIPPRIIAEAATMGASSLPAGTPLRQMQRLAAPTTLQRRLAWR